MGITDHDRRRWRQMRASNFDFKNIVCTKLPNTLASCAIFVPSHSSAPIKKLLQTVFMYNLCAIIPIFLKTVKMNYEQLY